MTEIRITLILITNTLISYVSLLYKMEPTLLLLQNQSRITQLLEMIFQHITLKYY